MLTALRRYSLDQAFIEIAHAAKSHAVATLALAEALVAIAQNRPTNECDPAAARIARDTWGMLLQRRTSGRGAAFVNEGQHLVARPPGTDAEEHLPPSDDGGTPPPP